MNPSGPAIPALAIRRLGIASSGADVAAAALLLGRYRAFVVASAGPGFRMPRLDAEIARLPGSYADPGSALFLAFLDGEPAGCVALRPAGTAAELKRMWVEEAARGRGVGRSLVEAAIAFAGADGRTAILLDTEPSRMEAAVHLYRGLGFRPTPVPPDAEPGLVFFRLDLPAAPI